MALQEDADLKSLITNVFTQMKVSDMAEYWRDFLSITDELLMNVYTSHVSNWDESIRRLGEAGSFSY